MTEPGLDSEAIWQQVECGAYGADLPAWVELATAAAGPVLELGAGTGRVALELAERGLEVVALDRSAELLADLAERARDAGLELETVCADARELALDRRFAAILAPMQLVHLLGGAPARAGALRSARAHLTEGGLVAAALLADDAAGPQEVGVLLPDVRELEGWVYSSLPIEVAPVDGAIEIRRLRQLVSPGGELSERTDSVRLELVSAAEFEREALAAGLAPRERIEVPPTVDHVGSTICVLEAA